MKCVVELIYVRGEGRMFDPDRQELRPGDLVIELPHGATDPARYRELRAQLKGDYPESLLDFFLVNTDALSPELALATAQTYVMKFPEAQVVIVCSRIPRTFVDCNRMLNLNSSQYRQFGVTPGMPSYVTNLEDLALLLELHGRYQREARSHIDSVCRAGGQALLLHTYAPRSVEVRGEIAPNIGAVMRQAWEHPERWPMRPAADLICRDKHGTRLVTDRVFGAFFQAFHKIGLGVGDSDIYKLFPTTAAYDYVRRWPDKVFCLEVRRDLLAEHPFDPFSVLKPSSNLSMVADAIVHALASSS